MNVQYKSLISCSNICPSSGGLFSIVPTFGWIRVSQIVVTPQRTFLELEQQAGVTGADRFQLTWEDERERGGKNEVIQIPPPLALPWLLIPFFSRPAIFEGN